jgi:hypothetical protein
VHRGEGSTGASHKSQSSIRGWIAVTNDRLQYLDEWAQEILPGRLRGKLQQWRWALIRQYQRVMDFDEPEEVRMNDLFIYPFCLRAILRIATLAEQLYGSAAIRQAIVEFNQQVPNAVQVRDVIEHYDEYVLGSGKLQKRDMSANGPGALPWMLNMGRTYLLTEERTCVLWLGGSLELDIRNATLAAYRLAEIVDNELPESSVEDDDCDA